MKANVIPYNDAKPMQLMRNNTA